jgi:hypothetical protein
LSFPSYWTAATSRPRSENKKDRESKEEKKRGRRKKTAKVKGDEEKCESRGVASASLLLGLYFPTAYFFSFVSV